MEDLTYAHHCYQCFTGINSLDPHKNPMTECTVILISPHETHCAEVTCPESHIQHVVELPLNPSSLAALYFLDKPAETFWGLGQAQIPPHVSCATRILYAGPLWFSGTYPASI